MANIFELKDRHVIPNWRSFKNTAKLGELNGSKKIEIDTSFQPDISDLIEEWESHKNIGMAGDILGTAIVCNQENNKTVQEVSQFILNQGDNVPKALSNAASRISEEKKEEIDFSFEINNIQTFQFKNLAILHEKIREYKQKLISNPGNAIAWVELSRLYSINGQETQAERAMRNALFLAPNNRFILRNMARFFVHIGDIEFAHDNIRKSPLAAHDPWVMATEIALADLRGRGSKFTKKGLLLIGSDSFHPFNTTELAGSIATLELNNANIKKSKRLFEKSLKCPNDNSLAQAEWASQEEVRLNIVNPAQFNIANSFEALALDAKQKKEWENAIEFSSNWFLDQPFSKSGVLFGSDIATKKLKDHNQAAEIAKTGLVSNPHDAQLLNNIVYYLSLENKIEEAEKHFKQIRVNELDDKDVNKICIVATKGLLYFRKGQTELGREHYLKAMQMSKDINNVNLSSIAFLNYAREEILANEEDDYTELMNKVEEVKTKTKNPEIINLAIDVSKLLKKENKP